MTDPGITLDEQIKHLKMLVLDIDGVMTDGRIGYCRDEEEEIKFFNVRDGRAILNAISFGFIVGFISGRIHAANRRRAQELKAGFIIEGQTDKNAALEEILQKYQITARECMYMGDDIQDIVLFEKVGFAVTVADAPPYIDRFCDYRTAAPGGHGAIREVIDLIFEKQGLLEKSINFFKERSR
ncbi:MAG: HAD hydrolase family protein [Victivallaceae bacterium]|nr:HAD hydrolase family protein [Victivallaceae bacterium]